MATDQQISKINIPIFKRPSLFNLAKEKIINFAKKSMTLAKEKINNFSDRIISYIIPEKKKATIEQVKILKDDSQKIYKKNPENKKAINDLFKEELNNINKNKEKTYKEIKKKEIEEYDQLLKDHEVFHKKK